MSNKTESFEEEIMSKDKFANMFLKPVSRNFCMYIILQFKMAAFLNNNDVILERCDVIIRMWLHWLPILFELYTWDKFHYITYTSHGYDFFWQKMVKNGFVSYRRNDHLNTYVMRLFAF